MNCPGISDFGTSLVKNGDISPSFNSYIFADYQTRYINTHLELENFNKKEDFLLVTTINGNKFYKYIGFRQSDYIQMHWDSLINLKNYKL